MDHKIAVYIGAGLDVRPIRGMKDITTFVYIDSRPANEFPGSGCKGHFHKSFFNEFHEKIMRLGFDYDSDRYDQVRKTILAKRPDVIEYTKDNVIVKYYMNTAFPSKHLQANVIADISKADTLIIAGHHPHESIMEMMKKPIDIVCWEGTWYGPEDHGDNTNSVVRRLYKDMSYIKSIKYYRKEYTMKFFDNISDVETFRD